MSTITESFEKSLQDDYAPGSCGNRSLNVLKAVVTPITLAIDTIIGVGAAIGTIVTNGYFRKLNNRAIKNLKISKELLFRPWTFAISAINPNAKTKIVEKQSYSIANYIGQKIFQQALTFSYSRNPIVNEGISRLTYALWGIATVVAKVVEAILCLPFLVFATVTFGESKTLNDLALNTLKFPEVIRTTLQCIAFTINPKLNL